MSITAVSSPVASAGASPALKPASFGAAAPGQQSGKAQHHHQQGGAAAPAAGQSAGSQPVVSGTTAGLSKIA